MSFFKKGELGLLWPFYITELISYMLFFAPAFMVLYFASIGFSFFQVGLFWMITGLSSFIFEVPTGAIADLYGRKFSVLLGYSIECLAFLSLFFVRDFYSVLLLFALLGFGSTFSSGSKEAWVVDLVKKKKNLSHSYFNKSQGFTSFALMVSGLIGAVLVKIFGLPIIWLFGSFSFLASILVLSFAKENFVKRKVKISQSLKEISSQTKKSISYGYKHPILNKYFIATFFLVIAFGFIGIIPMTAFLKDLQFPEHYFGYLWSMMGFVAMISPIVSSKLLKKGKEKQFIINSFILSGVVISFALITKSWIVGLSILIIAEFFISIRRPATRVFFHKFIPTKLRATIGSVESLIASLALIISPPLIGLLIDKIGSRYTLLGYPILIVLIVLIFLMMNEKELK